MPDRAGFLTFRFANQSLMAFLKKKRCLNSNHVVESDGRGRDRFYNTSHVSRTKNQSSKSGNQCTEMCFHKYVAFFHFVEHQWQFTTLFLQLFFCLEVIIDQVKLKQN